MSLSSGFRYGTVYKMGTHVSGALLRGDKGSMFLHNIGMHKISEPRNVIRNPLVLCLVEER
jgi:hypothetical protein